MKLKGLEEKKYSYLQEPLYKGRLTNGLTVYLLPKQDYHETYGMLTVEFGSLNTIFKTESQGNFVTYPAGIAHFLEHKLFETGEGKDILQEFAKLGANANAFTSFSQTSYLMSTSEAVLPALTLLQAFVREAAFTEESVEKEKEIIAQEIEMYLDEPDARLYTEVLASLYPGSPLEDDIAGSVESIGHITAQSLHENFKAFYQTKNMTLFLVGNFPLAETWRVIQDYQQSQMDQSSSVERKKIIHQPVLEKRSIQMEVACPKLAIGVRGNQKLAEESIYRYRLSLSLLFAMLFGWTSKRHQSLYENGKIDSSFSFHLEIQSDYQFFVMTLDSKEPIALSKHLRKALTKFERDEDLSESHLELVKKESYGDFIHSLNSLEYTASHFMQYLSETETIFDLPEILQKITLEDVINAGRTFISNCDMTDFIIFPK